MLQDLSHAGEAFFDPRARRGLKDLLPIAPETIELFVQRVDVALCVHERLREGPAAAPFTDEVDEMRQAPFLGRELDFLEPNRLRDMGIELGDLRFDALEDVFDVFGMGELCADRLEDDAFDEAAPDQQFIVAGAFRRRDAAVIATAFPADLRHRRTAQSAHHRTGEQMRWEMRLPASLDGREAAPSGPAGPGAPDVLTARLDTVPEIVRHDAQRLVLVDDPLGGRLRKRPPASRSRITPEFALVPDPAADIFLVIQEPTHGRGGPAFGRAHAAGDRVVVEHADDPDDRAPRGIRLENAQDDGGLARLGFEFVALWPRPALFVDTRGADGDGAVAVGVLADGEAALLLPDLAAQRLLLEILELQFVKDAADLNAERRLLIVTVEPVGD